MSARFAAERLARVCADAPRSVESTVQADTLAVIDGEDIDAASRSPARLLITAPTQQSIETLARRIHGNGLHAEFPFVVTAAGELPVGAHALRKACVRLLDAAAEGSVLLRAVDEMPSAVQETFIDLLTELESPRRPSAAVRLISGTTVSLLARVAEGAFSERLFYRLNIIHLIVGQKSPAAALI